MIKSLPASSFIRLQEAPIVYHSTVRSFPDEKLGKDANTWLGTHAGSPEQAEQIFNGSWNLEAPRTFKLDSGDDNRKLRVKDLGEWWTSRLWSELKSLGVITKEDEANILSWGIKATENMYGGPPTDEDHIVDTIRYKGKEVTKYMKDKLISLGYDGLVYLNRAEGHSKADSKIYVPNRLNISDAEFKSFRPSAHDSYILFNPNNVLTKPTHASELNIREPKP